MLRLANKLMEDNAIKGNVMNDGLITNLMADTCVEVPCLADGAGIHPCFVGALPNQLASLNRNFANGVEHRVRAALSGSREDAYFAAQLDPLTAASLPLPTIRQMVDALLEAEQRFFPQFSAPVSGAKGDQH